MNRYCATLICTFAAFLEGICRAVGDIPNSNVISDAEITTVIERAEADPNALSELKDAPIEKTFQPLADLWFNARYLLEQRGNARKVGQENERQWLELQKEVGRDPESAIRILPVVEEVLFSHRDLEAHLTAQLQNANDYLTNYYIHGKSTPGMPPLDPNLVNKCLGVATRLSGDGAFRVVGSFLSAPDFPDLDRGDIRPRAPAKAARDAMARLAKQRLGIDIPDNVEETRRWWAENQHRFAAKPPENRPSPPLSSDSVAAPQAPPQPDDAVVAIPSTTNTPGNKAWLYASLIGLLSALAVAAWLYSRSGRT